MAHKYICFLIALSCFYAELVFPRYVRHASVYIQEEVILGTEFSMSIKSDRGKIEESFFINKIPMLKAEYYKELEFAQLAELRKEREKIECQKRKRIAFADEAQVAIIEKLISKKIQEIIRILSCLQHEQLKQYYVFHKDTIDSIQKLSSIIDFVNEFVRAELKESVELNDMQRLQTLLDKIDQWPDRLESFFQASVQHAIKHSDDTAMLKELLSVLAQ